MTLSFVAFVLLAAQTPLSPPDVDAVFRDRLAEYVTLRDDFARLAVLPLEPSDARTIVMQRQRLARALRLTRGDVAQGNIFGGAVATAFRRIAATLVDYADVREWVSRRDLAMAVAMRTRVNEPLPDGADHEVHVALVAAFPPLPKGIYYRVVHYDLVLWDADADLVLDVLSGAFMPPTF